MTEAVQYLTTREAARLMKRTVRHVRDLCVRGELTAIMPANRPRWLIERASVERWLQENAP